MSHLYFFKKAILSAIIGFGLLNAVIAQTNTQLIKGKILDDYGHAIEGAKVQVKGSLVNVLTNKDGAFEIDAQVKNMLVISSQGLDIAEHIIKDDKSLVIRLNESYLRSEKKVDMLYETKEKELMVGSVGTVYNSQLSTTPASLYGYALTGRLAGLFTTQTQGFRTFMGSGDANTTSDLIGSIARTGLSIFSDNSELSIRLRGQNPVVLIDGIQRDIYSLDPENIESISVAKDALSSIALGQRSSKGMLLVTTKRLTGGAPRLSFTAEYGVQQPLKLPKPIDAFNYSYFINEALLNDGKKAMYSTADLEAFKSGTDPYKYPDVNWYDEVYRKSSLMSRYNLSITGGGKVARYAVSLSYMDQDGLLNISNKDAKMQLQRYLINSYVDIDVTKDFTVNVQLFGRLHDAYQPGATTATILSELLRTPNNAYPIFNRDGSLGGNNSFSTNLYALLNNSGYIENHDRDIMANVNLKYKLDRWVPGLWAKLNGNIAVQSAIAINRSKQDPVFLMQTKEDGSNYYTRYGSAVAQVNNYYNISNTRYWYSQFEIGYDKKIGDDHTFRGTLMGDWRRSTLNYDLPGTASNYVAKMNYDYQKKYMAEAAVNYSGYDRYMPGNKFGAFYALGAGWNMAQENFIKDNVSWLNTLKLRATYGLTGNGVDNSGYFIWRQVYKQDYWQTAVIGVGHSVAAPSAFVESALANTGITWEKAHKFDVGLDVSAFKDKLQFTADFYRDVYFDLLQIRGKSISIIGSAYPAENIGKNLYTGAEFTATYQNNVGAFNYFVTGNASIEKTKVLFMDEQRREYEWNKRTGLPVGQRFGYIAEGFFQTEEDATTSAIIPGYEVHAGDIKYKDMNGDNVIDQFDETAIGKTTPLFYYGLTAGFNYKGFGFSVLFQGVKNRNLYIDNYNVMSVNGKGQLYGQLYDEIYARWTPETSVNAAYPRLKANAEPFLGIPQDKYSLAGSTFWMHSGDYWRIKNINVQYTLPYNWVNRIKVAGITVFVNAQNLFTWSAFDKVDPEVQAYGVYPIQRVINTGINVKF